MKRNILLGLSLLFLGACELETPPESDLTYTGFWNKEEAAKSVHSGVYSRFRSYGYTMWLMGELRSDIWGGKGIENSHNQDLYTNDINITKVAFNNWGNWYSMLHYINDFIKNAPQTPFSNENEKKNMLAQMYGLRAYIYYTMLKSWGDVPLVTEPLQNVNNLTALKKARAPKAEVLAFIKQDIQRSLDLFEGNENFYRDNVYWSKRATLILKGDVFLWSGKVLGGGATEFTEAKNALSQVSGALVPYENLWGIDNEKNTEFIFALDYKKDEAEHFYKVTTARNTDVKDKFDDSGRKISSFLYVEGGNYNSPSEKTLRLIDDVKDQRRATFVRVYSDNVGHIPFNTTNYLGSILSKFVGRNNSGDIVNENNVPIYRYADVLLLLAEAKNNLGEDPSAEINQVRARAYGSNYNVATHGYTNSTKANNAKAILDERYKEFIGEGKRWWDLLRAGDNYVYDEVASMTSNGRKKNIYLPISPAMIADDNTLVQTPGYK